MKLPEGLLVRQNQRALLCTTGSFANKADPPRPAKGSCDWLCTANGRGASWDLRHRGAEYPRVQGWILVLVPQGACKTCQWHWDCWWPGRRKDLPRNLEWVTRWLHIFCITCSSLEGNYKAIMANNFPLVLFILIQIQSTTSNGSCYWSNWQLQFVLCQLTRSTLKPQGVRKLLKWMVLWVAYSLCVIIPYIQCF